MNRVWEFGADFTLSPMGVTDPCTASENEGVEGFPNPNSIAATSKRGRRFGVGGLRLFRLKGPQNPKPQNLITPSLNYTLKRP